MAAWMDQVCLVRSMQHTMRNHNSATYYSLTGYALPVDDIRLRDSPDLFPAYGSIVDKLAPVAGGMPTFVAFPHVLRDGSITPGQHASFLGKAYNPLFFSQDPNAPDFGLPELQLPADVPLERLEARREMLKLIDEQSKLLDESATARGIDDAYQKAVGMLTSPKVRQAFDLAKNRPPSATGTAGRPMANRACSRAGSRGRAKFINVYFASAIGGRKGEGGWDTHGFGHNPMAPILRDYLLPITDHTLPTLLQDLKDRGLLETTR